jgi:CRISPR/Cas system-associated protein Cas7 (RAMP superfamily)
MEFIAENYNYWFYNELDEKIYVIIGSVPMLQKGENFSIPREIMEYVEKIQDYIEETEKTLGRGNKYFYFNYETGIFKGNPTKTKMFEGLSVLD